MFYVLSVAEFTDKMGIWFSSFWLLLADSAPALYEALDKISAQLRMFSDFSYHGFSFEVEEDTDR
jgi:hypothetical protein